VIESGDGRGKHRTKNDNILSAGENTTPLSSSMHPTNKKDCANPPGAIVSKQQHIKFIDNVPPRLRQEPSSNDLKEGGITKLAYEESAARFLADQFIGFKGCEKHARMGQNAYGMSRFTEERVGYDLPKPDFAQEEYLPFEARNEKDPRTPNGCKKMRNGPFSHSSPTEWTHSADSFKRSLCGLNHQGDIRSFHMGAEDMTKHSQKPIRDLAHGKLTVDIDSALLLFTDLSLIQCTIDISMVWSPWKNLSSSVHITHHGVPLHRIPHLFLGRFGHDLDFDLYLFAPAAYNKGGKRKREKPANRLSETVMASFMNCCLLKAVHDCIPATHANQWPTRYEIQNAKSTAPAMEGRLYDRRGHTRHMNLTVPLVEQYIAPVWDKCLEYLMREIRQPKSPLSVLDGFQLFACSKNTKDRFFGENISDAMSLFKVKVYRVSS